MSNDFFSDLLASISERGRTLLRLGPATVEKLGRYFASVQRAEGFGNGRFARGVFQHMTEQHAARVAELATPTTEQLTELGPEDLPDVPGD